MPFFSLAEMEANKSKYDDFSEFPHKKDDCGKPSTLAYQHLESLRMKNLGLDNKYSRHFNVKRSHDHDDTKVLELPGSCNATTPRQAQQMATMGADMPLTPGTARRINNTVAPFATYEKPTCGVFFSFDTDNRRKNFGIPASNLVKWRNFSQAAN